jgi:hypothetical protein
MARYSIVEYFAGFCVMIGVAVIWSFIFICIPLAVLFWVLHWL